MNRQQMLDYFSEQTGGFEPKNPSTIKLMTNNPQEQQELGSAIPKLGQLKEIDFTKLAQKIVLPFDVDAQNANNMYVRLLAELNSKDPAKIPTSQEISQSQDMVNKIKFSSGSDQQKRQDFLLLLSNRGFPLDKLKALGLTEGLY
jgi:antitoxin component of RelBE/YafQ-DinJ toxin-antitoxin module